MIDEEKRKKTAHVVVRFKEGDWYCGHCGASYTPPDRPEPLYMFIAMLKAFTKTHEKCPAPEAPKDGCF